MRFIEVNIFVFQRPWNCFCLHSLFKKSKLSVRD